MSTCRIGQPSSSAGRSRSAAAPGRSDSGCGSWAPPSGHALPSACCPDCMPELAGGDLPLLPGLRVPQPGAAGLRVARVPAGLMSAYGDCRKPLACTSTRRWPVPPAGSPPAPAAATAPVPGGSTAGRAATAPPARRRPARERRRPLPPRARPCTPSSQQPVARIETPRGPVRRTSPRTSSSQEENTVAAYGPWASSKKVASTGPVASSRVRKTTRRPQRTGGVWVATFTPATSTSALRPRRRSRSRARASTREGVEHRDVEVDDVAADVEAEHLELGAHPLRRRSSRAARCATSPGASPRSRASWTSRSAAGATAWDWPAPRGRTMSVGPEPTGPAAVAASGIGPGARARRGPRPRRPARVCRSRSATCSSRSRRVTRPAAAHRGRTGRCRTARRTRRRRRAAPTTGRDDPRRGARSRTASA